MTSHVRRAAVAIATVLVLSLVAGACSSDDPPEAPAAAPSETPEPEVETSVTFGQVAGRLPKATRERLKKQIGDVVDGWMEAAYLSGEYPRRAFRDVWPAFTPGARDLAHRDRGLMSNADIGERIDGVEARRREARLDVVAVRQRPVGVTARVLLVFRATGKAERVVRVQGRLFLTRTGNGWRVFGYDVTKGDDR